MRFRNLFIVSIAAISLLAAGTTVVAADTGIPVASAAAVQAPVNLGTAGTFAILSKSGITDVYSSAILGDVGTSPITGAAIGLECDEVTGTVYTVNAAGPACRVVDPTTLTLAVGAMETALQRRRRARVARCPQPGCWRNWRRDPDTGPLQVDDRRFPIE